MYSKVTLNTAVYPKVTGRGGRGEGKPFLYVK